jgi:predicted acetyltransferase
MDVALIDAVPTDLPLLERLMQLYAYDFSEIMNLEIGLDGRFAGGPPLASCWSEPWRHAFVIRVDGKIGGFCILDERSRLTGDFAVADVAEFFVLRRYRRMGVGRLAARAAFAKYPRRWEVRETAANVAATGFWRRVIGELTGGAFTETMIDDARWRGPVQSFDLSAGA